MKKIFALVICIILLVCAFPISAFAEGESVDGIETTVQAVDTSPITEESASEEEISVEEAMVSFTTEDIMNYIKTYFEEISVIITLILTAFYNIRKHKILNKSISATNLNAIRVSENSDLAIAEALATIQGYKDAFANLLTEFRATEEEKQKLEQTLGEALAYIKTAKLANVEFANELAELLVLANIPNSKKDELYSRHIAAVKAIAEAEKTEVNTNDDGDKT